MLRIKEIVKEDIGLIPQSLASTSGSGEWFPMANYRKVLAHLMCGAIAASGTVTVALNQAKDKLGTGSKAITNATATITALSYINKATIALAATGAGDTVTINGVTFTQGSTVVASRTFANAAGLVSCINSNTYGVANVYASANGTTVTVVASDTGENTITISETNVGGTITIAGVEAEAYVEVESSQLDLANSFCYVGVTVTTANATVLCAVSLQRADARVLPAQQVGASATV
jgi:hypothetical protein